MRTVHGMLLTAVVGVGGLCVGCQKATEETKPDAGTTEVAVDDHGHDGHGHDGWWCGEHGVPEEVCALCDRTLVSDFKAKGDWCAKHERPDSQCFECHPERAATFAAKYEAKYGHQPPAPEKHAHEHE